MPRRTKIPNCTHVKMDRVYGHEQFCFVCGRQPSIGFLYECRQDFDSLEGAHGDDASSKSKLRQDLEEVELSESIILAAERGDYTEAQLELLKTQKRTAKHNILDATQFLRPKSLTVRMAFLSSPFSHDGANNTKGKPVSSCAFRACHTCRPYYKDRIWISFGAVLSGRFAPLTPADATTLPVKSAKVMAHIGLQPASFLAPVSDDISPSTLPSSSDFSEETNIMNSRASTLTFKTTQTDMDYFTAMGPRRRFYSLGYRSSGDLARDLSRLPSLSRPALRLRSAIQGIFRVSRDSSSSGSNITLPLPRTGTARHLDQSTSVREFDIGSLRRVERQFEDVTEPSMEYHSAREGLDLSRMNRGGLISSYGGDSNISDGSEVEVEGGLALTEEAVNTHTPDILSHIFDETEAAVVDNIVLQTIMTQA